jgi:hypothetical protein
MKNIKTLGLLAIAAMALVAFVGTTSASATTSFTASATGKKIVETTITNHVFTTTGSNTTCTNITYTGVTEGAASGGLGFTSTTQKVTPKYEGCTAFGFSATVKNNGCEYVMNAAGSVLITPESCTLTILVENGLATCHVEVTGGQTVGGITIANGAANDLVITINSSGIKSHVTKSSGFCPLTVGTHTSSYTGKSTVQAEGASIAVD